MTDVEITPQAEDHLKDLDPEARERVLKKLIAGQKHLPQSTMLSANLDTLG